MKKVLLLIAVMLAFSFTVLAQGTSGSMGSAPSTDKTTKSTKSGGAAKTQTITGCLAKTDSGYTITNGNYKKGAAVKTADDWSAHNGHTVQLTGMWDKSGATPVFNATSMKHISGTCTAGGGKAATGGAKKGTDSAMPPPKS